MVLLASNHGHCILFTSRIRKDVDRGVKPKTNNQFNGPGFVALNAIHNHCAKCQAVKSLKKCLNVTLLKDTSRRPRGSNPGPHAQESDALPLGQKLCQSRLLNVCHIEF